ncbi:T9SS type A sorting domain-containing protein [Chryseobacterium luquanense]|uniref:Fibronectin type III domain-containing protein n=1 Tax=Chryseobacterium luquanense TaxID=2983766 RepID=A0ABT3Y0S8_9FLAO|nr:fibronectin type III domain-containing protein [Chryseobacterium luquanense]MCX8531706.1 fibronectin type III domain-containing protein [Chryseobacterium luquanense]
MKVKRLFGLAAVVALFGTQKVAAQYYYPVAVSGFTQDVIANGIGSSAVSVTSPVDDANFAYISRDFQATATTPAPTYGLPATGQFMTIVTGTPGLTYQLASYSGSNSLKLNAANDTGTLTFTTPTAAYNLYFLATGGSGPAVASAIVNFSDGTSQSFTNLAVADWYGGTNAAIQGIGRVNITNNNLEDGGGTNPRIYQIPLAILAANQSKTVQSVSFTKVSGSGFINIFGISADKYTTCLAPSAVTASAVTASSATLSWTAPTTLPTNYDVYYTSSTVAPSGTTAPSISGIAAATLTTNIVSGINSMTKYHVWIRSNCGTTVGQWAYGTTFTTPCSVFPASYTENFDTTTAGSTTNTNAPMCWSYLETSGFAGYGYVINSNSNSPSNSYYLYNSSASTGNQMLVSPQTTALSDGTKRVKFFAKGSAGYTLQVGTLTNPTDPSTFVSFNTTTITANYAQYTVNIPSGGGSYLAFRHNLGGTYRGIYLDDITVQAIPSCFEPTAVTSSNIMVNSASIGWAAPATAPANGYEVYYSTSNTAPTFSTVLDTTNSTTSTTLSASANGLTSATTYYAWVRSVCSATDKSDWSASPTTFTTTCTSTNVPYTQDFESATVPALANCTTAQNLGTGNIWTTNSPGGYGFTSKVLSYLYNSTNAANTWFYTQGINLTAGVQYTISYKYGNNGGTTYVEKMKVAYGTSADAASMTNAIADHPNITNSTAAITSTVNFTPTTTGIYYFGFNCYSIADRNRLFLDDISITQSSLATSETAAAKKEVKIYPNPFSDVINISEFKDIKTIKVNDVAGRTLKTIENPTKEINLSSLNSGLYLITMYFKDGSQHTVKTIKK